MQTLNAIFSASICPIFKILFSADSGESALSKYANQSEMSKLRNLIHAKISTYTVLVKSSYFLYVFFIFWDQFLLWSKWKCTCNHSLTHTNTCTHTHPVCEAYIFISIYFSIKLDHMEITDEFVWCYQLPPTTTHTQNTYLTPVYTHHLKNKCLFKTSVQYLWCLNVRNHSGLDIKLSICWKKWYILRAHFISASPVWNCIFTLSWRQVQEI